MFFYILHPVLNKMHKIYVNIRLLFLWFFLFNINLFRIFIILIVHLKTEYNYLYI